MTAWHTEVFWLQDRLPRGASKSSVLKLSSLLLTLLTAQFELVCSEGSLFPLLLPEDSYFVRFLLSSWNPDPCLARGQEEVCFPGVVMSKCLLCGFLSTVIPKGLPVSLLFENELSYKYRSRKEAGSRG